MRDRKERSLCSADPAIYSTDLALTGILTSNVLSASSAAARSSRYRKSPVVSQRTNGVDMVAAICGLLPGHFAVTGTGVDVDIGSITDAKRHR
jgi:hypothetical protein